MRRHPAALPALAALALVTGLLGSLPAAEAGTTSRRAPHPALTATPAAPLQGARVVLRSKLPTAFARPTVLQRRAGRHWKRVAAHRSGSGGVVRYRVAPKTVGTVRYRVVAPRLRHAGRVAPAVTTRVRKVRVRSRAELVSVAITGRSSGAESGIVSLSGDGRFVAFHSDAQSLVTGYTGYVDGSPNVYLRDRVAGTTVLVSHGAPGVTGNSDSARPAISRNGRYVAFASTASNLVPGDANGKQDVFRWDRLTNAITKITEAGAGGGTDDNSYDPSISADGQRIVYSSDATNIDADDDNGFSDVYLWDSVDDESDRISRRLLGGDADGSSYGQVISADGAFVTFNSGATDLVFSDTNGVRDSFRYDVEAETVALVSRGFSGAADDYSSVSTISGTGRYVAFASAADNLVDGGTPDSGKTNVFVRDMTTGTTVLVSRARDGDALDGYAYPPGTVSDDGRFVTFPSDATDLVAGDTNGFSDAFLWDRQRGANGTVSRIVRDRTGAQPNGASYEPALSADARWVGFYSVATDLVRTDTDPAVDVYVWRR